uniref:Cystatin domain-containing protein n=1 Tax=Castor canadensis TaxID=51338 RepID=A0A8C0ZP98_CASCN|nr:cystatin-8 [Castor canadensis]
MTRPWWLSLLLFTILVALVSSTDPVKNEVNVLRSLKSINASNANVKQCVWFAMQEYNKENKDKYVFLVSKILRAQLQITYHMEFLIDVEIVRSNCRKPLSNDVLCNIQQKSKLEKKLNCNFLVGALPWNGKFTVLKKQCDNV